MNCHSCQIFFFETNVQVTCVLSYHQHGNSATRINLILIFNPGFDMCYKECSFQLRTVIECTFISEFSVLWSAQASNLPIRHHLRISLNIRVAAIDKYSKRSVNDAEELPETKMTIKTPPSYVCSLIRLLCLYWNPDFSYKNVLFYIYISIIILI